MSGPSALVIAAPRSGGGKTIVTLGLLRAYRQRGVAITGVKSGPDYIDPAFHAAASGREGLNLDSWAMPPELIRALAWQAASECELMLCEGSMGLFDGAGERGRSGASAEVAATLGAPVILVLDISGQAQSAAAVAKGCATYDPAIEIAGIVLNKVASERHRRLAAQAIEALGIPIVGALPRLDALGLPERHLGLVQAGETRDLDRQLDEIAELVSGHIDLVALRALAKPMLTNAAPASACALDPPGQRIAIARDDAFSFIYPHLIAGWRAAGAELSFFSPLADEAPSRDCDFCWLPGGYPELHAGKIAAAANFLSGLRAFAADRPVHGECGGYMALGEALIDAKGLAHPMAGLLGVETSFAARKLNLGYRAASLVADCALGPAGRRLLGHEFHYSTLLTTGGDEPLAMVGDAYGSPPARAGSRRGRVTGGYFHLIAAADPIAR